MDKQNMREAAEEVLAGWCKLASSLPQNDAVEALEWGAMQQLRNAISAQGEPESGESVCPDCHGSEFHGFKRGVRCKTCDGLGLIQTPSASTAAPEAAKPADWTQPHPPSRHCMCPDCIPSFDDRFVAAKPEQQAQAGEPEVVAWMWQHDETTRTGFVEAWQLENGWEEQNPRCKIVGPLITLQSHREAMAPLQQRAKVLDRVKAALAIKGGDEHYPTEWAYLQASKVIDLQKEAIAKKDAALKAFVEVLENANGNRHFPMFDAAITQAKEAQQ